MFGKPLRPGKCSLGILALAFLLLLVLIPVVWAQSGAGYGLNWWSIDGGGGVLGTGKYLLQGAVGQPDAAAPLIHGRYRLAGGFWNSPLPSPHPIYLPLMGKNAH